MGAGSNSFNANNWDTRWDWFVSSRQSLFGRYSYQQFDQLAPAAFGIKAGGPALQGNRFSGSSEARNQSLAIGYTRTINPTMVNDFRFGYMRYRVNVLPGDIGSSPAKDAGIPGLNLDPYFTSGIPYFHIQGDGETKIGYSLDANGWVPVESADGVIDSLREKFTLDLTGLTPGEHLLVIRAADSANNSGLAKVVLK